VGTELLLALAEFLCLNYKKNPAVTQMGERELKRKTVLQK
ncbi:CPD isoform 8, partial [Pan troglodytes]